MSGEVTVYSKILDEAQAQATLDMMEDAKAMGVDAIICIRYSTA